MQGPAKPKREEPPAQPWAPPRTLGLRRRPEMFLLPDGAGSSRVSYAGWAGGPEHPDPEREVLLQNWGYLTTHIAEPRLEKELEDAVESFFSTRFLPSEKDLFRFQERRCFDWLWHEAEALKKRLFGAVHREHGQEFFPSFDCLKRFRSGISLRGAPPKLVEEIPWALEPVAETILSAGADEVYEAISGALQSTVVQARKLAEGRRVDRIALSGRSSRIPMVRWLLARPKGEGGLGVPPSMIDFDEENAKSAVSKGACLLQVMRETLVGFEVDVADFKANLLSDLFYLQLDGSRRVLFKAGSIDDLSSFEESPEPRSIPKYLSIFAGSDHNLIGQFLFHDEGEALPPASRRPSSTAGPMPPYKELLQFREKDRTRYGKCIAELLRWPDRERIAWMEQGAPPGAPDLPIYRYYLTRNQALYAVRDAGEGAKRLHEIRPADGPRPGLSPEDNPFSGIH